MGIIPIIYELNSTFDPKYPYMENPNLHLAEEFVLHTRKNLFLTGRAGTGKTTLLQLITRQLNPDRGQILVDGVDIATLSLSDL